MNIAAMTADETLAAADTLTLDQLEAAAVLWQDVFPDVSAALWAKLDAKRGR